MITSTAKAIEILDQLISEAKSSFLNQNITETSLNNWNYQLNLALTRIYSENSPEHSLLHTHSKKIAILGASTNSDRPDHFIYAQYGSEQIQNQVQSLLQLMENLTSGNVRDEASIASSPHKDIGRICKRFHLISKQLRVRHDERESLIVNDEYDTQDLFRSLLQLYFDDIRPEEWAPSYAGSGSRVDFLLKQEEIIIEIKKTRKTLQKKQVGEQLIIDIAKYQSHPDCKSLICFVYDPEGWVVNPAGLENDLSGTKDGLNVSVYIVPK